METKICIKCKENKELSNYTKKRNGKNAQCKSCIREYEYNNRKKISLRKKIEYSNRSIEEKKRRLEEANKRRLQRLKEDPIFAMKIRLRDRSRKAFSFSKWNKKSSSKDLLGCDYGIVFNHIENQFTEGMTWDNRNEWHIDHIIPLASATTEEELIKLCHYTNLQPLWAEDNLRKGSKIIEAKTLIAI